MPIPRPPGFSLLLLAALLSGGAAHAQPTLDPAADATQAIDSRLVGKTPTPDAFTLFIVANYDKGSDFKRNPHLWCADLTVYLTCFSPWNSSEHTYQGGTLVSPKNALFAEHFSGASGSNTLHKGDKLRFVGNTGVTYSRTLVATPEEVSDTDICVGTFAESPLPPDVVPAEVFPPGVSQNLLPPGTPVIFCNKNKEVRVAEVASFVSCAIRPATSPNRAPWTLAGPAVVGDSGSPVFVVLDGRPVLWFLFHTPGSGPSISNQITGINALLADGYKLKIAGGR